MVIFILWVAHTCSGIQVIPTIKTEINLLSAIPAINRDRRCGKMVLIDVGFLTRHYSVTPLLLVLHPERDKAQRIAWPIKCFIGVSPLLNLKINR